MKKVLFVLSAFVLVFFNACKKDAVAPGDTSEVATTSSEDISDAESYTQSTEDEADVTIQAPPPSTSCTKVSFSNVRGKFPQTVTIDFGTGCTDANGRLRKGKIIVTYSDTLIKANATKTVTYQNYYIDSIKIEGTRTWKYNGLNAQNQPFFTRTVTNAKITFPDATFASWNATHTVTRTEGNGTPLNLLDDAWSVTGSESGTNRKGKTFSATINSPIIHKTVCPWPISGVRTITVNGNSLSLDYSYGVLDCDNQALLTLPSGETKVIKIRGKRF